ncbi:MAG: site-specific DNA-methyltransferase [Candidatus Paceibacterota bacterium]
MAKKDYTNWDRKELIKEIDQLRKRKKYGLVWEDKPEDVVEKCKTESPVLEEVKSKEIITDPDKPVNLLIEGDNYHALSVLNYTHKGRVDVIYIDPPYNTGKDDFVYNDRYIDAEDTYRHSMWLSFMYSRLVLARKLLRNDGVIFISIDDNELTNLMSLCNGSDLFDEKNFVGVLIHKNNSSKNQANLLSISTEYMLVYAKNKKALTGKKWRIAKKGARDIANMFNKLKNKGLSVDEIHEQINEMYSRPKYAHLSRWNKVDEKGVFADADLSREGGPTNFTIINPTTNKKCVIPPRGWGKNYEDLLQMQRDNLIWYGDEETPPRVKDYIQDDREMVPDNFMYFDNSSDTRLIKDMFGDLVFENPKPKDMIKHVISMVTDKSALILDFFAGSGTTAQAVHELNAENKDASYQYILCTDNEVEKRRIKELEKNGLSKGMSKYEIEGICQKICYPRIEKVINGYVAKSKKKIKGIGGNLRYYRTAFVPADPTDKNKTALTKKATEMLCVKENTFEKVKSNKDYVIFGNNKRYTGIIYDHQAIDDFKKEIAKIDGKFSVYVFSLGDDIFDEEFADMKSKVKLSPIPEAILRVYRRIFK